MRTIIQGIFLVVAILLTTGCSLTESSNDSKLDEREMKADAKKYLNSKYAVEMQIVGIEEYGAGQKKVIASPVTSDITFPVYYHGTNPEDPKFKGKLFHDFYKDELWKKQISNEVKPIIHQDYPDAIVEPGGDKGFGSQGENIEVPFADTDIMISKPFEKDYDLPKMMDIVKQWKANKFTEGFLRFEFTEDVFKITTEEYQKINQPNDLLEYKESNT